VFVGFRYCECVLLWALLFLTILFSAGLVVWCNILSWVCGFISVCCCDTLGFVVAGDCLFFCLVGFGYLFCLGLSLGFLVPCILLVFRVVLFRFGFPGERWLLFTFEFDLVFCGFVYLVLACLFVVLCFVGLWVVCLFVVACVSAGE